MNWMGLNELKEVFLNFFVNKGHKNLKSFSLVPEEDFSLLFINSGMAPMKKWFLNFETPPSKRVVTAQRCIRTADIERVGKTDRHGTFFEMLGNFSFGDYFKKEAIFWAWEFVTKVLKIPKKKLYVTVYEKDFETFKIWEDEVKVLNSHIVTLGKEDNFWEIGVGPCGPCSEIYYDRGEKYGCGKKSCAPGCDCDRFIEFWNLVFSQYEKKEDGSYVELKQKNIDTGMGLERLATIMQNVNNIFEVDTIRKILEKVCFLADCEYGKDYEKDVLIRIITDHIRSIVFLIADGVLPSNEERGYVLRKLIRRAHVSGVKLNIKSAFLKELVELVAQENYAVTNNLKYIKNIIRNEEEAFENILKNSEAKALKLFEKLKRESTKKYEEIEDYFNDLKNCFKRFRDGVEIFFNELQQHIKNSNFDGFNVKKLIFSEIEKDFVKISEIKNLICFEKEVSSIKLLFALVDEFKNFETLREEDFNLFIEKYSELIKEIFQYFEDLLLKKRDEGLIKKTVKILGFEDNFKAGGNLKVPADEAFKLCDTFGLPFEVLKDMAVENGFYVDEEGFSKLMQQQKEKAKKTTSFKNNAWKEKFSSYFKLPATEFVGYDVLECEVEILAVVEDYFEDIGENEVALIFNKTPIYAVGGGQIADSGEIFLKGTEKCIGVIVNCEKLESGQYVHRVKFFEKPKHLKVGEVLTVKVDEIKRGKISKNHTAAHILQKALILELGDHLRQAGQLIDEKRIRFDFTHSKPLSEEELKNISDVINYIILKGVPVVVREMELKKAQEEGAIALFNEKYGSVVRVVEVLKFSKELCGGTHVKNTREIGAFKIMSETSVAAGVRRIEAITGFEVLKYAEKLEKILNSGCKALAVKNYDELEEKVKNLALNFKKAERDLSDCKIKLCKNEFLVRCKEKVKKVGEFYAVIFKEKDLNNKEFRIFADFVKNIKERIVVLIFAEIEKRFSFLVISSNEAVKCGAEADFIVKRLAEVVNKKGGGKKDFAMAGLENFNCSEKLKEEFSKILEELKN